MKINLICQSCKKTFETEYKFRNKKYCNQKCYIDSGIKGKPKQDDFYENRQCVNCGEQFNIRKKLKNKLCSDKCRSQWNLNPINKEKRIKKSKESIFKKYGVDSILKTKEGQKKMKESFLKKYGQKHPMHVNNFVDKLKTTLKNKQIPILLEKLKNHNLILLDEYEQNKLGNTSKSYNFKCLNCNNTFSSTLLGSGKIPICRKCNPITKNSSIEQILKDFLNEKNIVHTNNNRTKLNGKEIDLLLDEKSIGFEINGNYFHSEIYGLKDKNYHIDKTKLANEKGIKLIHIFEDEIKNKQNIVFSRISNMLNLNTNRIYARKCSIKEITKKESKTFNIINHIQGDSVDKYRFGLFYNNELVSVMTFGKKRNSLGNKTKIENEYELLRFSNKLNTNVIGSFSKLLSYFIKKYSPRLILTFADIRWSGINYESTVYFKNGFTFIGITPPNYWYVHSSNFSDRKHRFQFRKDVLIKEGFDKTKSEWEIIQENGYDRIWDCGSMKFELKC